MADETRIVISMAAERRKRAARQRITDRTRAYHNRYIEKQAPVILADAVERRDAARARWQELEAQPWSKAKRDAAEELEFWSSKVAFLGAGR